jgi:hypothetical protein
MDSGFPMPGVPNAVDYTPALAAYEEEASMQAYLAPNKICTTEYCRPQHYNLIKLLN